MSTPKRHPIYLWHVTEAAPCTKVLAVRATHVRVSVNGAVLLIDRNADDPDVDYDVVFAAPQNSPCWVQRIAKVTTEDNGKGDNALTSNDTAK